jgi:hypothetical protein
LNYKGKIEMGKKQHDRGGVLLRDAVCKIQAISKVFISLRR